MKSIRPFFPALALTGALSVASACALAESMAEAAPSVATYIFKSYDGDADGSVSAEEFRDTGGQEQTFSRLDADHDRHLSMRELAELHAPVANP